MISKLEILPNEIFINILSYLTWDEILISLWSLNKRINSIICLIFTIKKNGITFNYPGLSYQKISEILLPLIFKSSLLCSSIKYIHLNGNYSNSYDLIDRYFFYNKDKESFCFPNLKSLNITQFLLSKSLIEILSLLVQYQLNELKLIYSENEYRPFAYQYKHSSFIFNKKNLMVMFEKFLCQIFSGQCQLISLQLDISQSNSLIHQCLKSHSLNLSSNKIDDLNQLNCLTLRYLHICIQYTYFLEHLIEHVPNLERLTVRFQHSLKPSDESYSNIEKLTTSNESWFNKVPKLKCFILKTRIFNDLEFIYLKWLLNNVNHIEKLQISLIGQEIWRNDQIIWKSVIDANFIRQYCLPDKIINLIDFDFYIRSKRQLSLIDIEKIQNSFQIDSFFIKHQWTNVRCFYDENKSYQHLFSFTQNKSECLYMLTKYRCIDNWPNIRCIQLNFHPSLYLFLEQFDELCPNVSSIMVRPENYTYESMITEPLTISFEMGQRSLNDIRLENVTKLQFGSCCSCSSGMYCLLFFLLTKNEAKSLF
ncbi:unnamed protein product [Rotaria sordida]|uniref:F-box domain-containing protein n=1 Tax=Rotaria sordida TaxID=392033 RepID=A0A815IA99_9BILA|nr:unnamed protein product [Rotaria sordida]CAF1363019.1 unnamed protein product [Rotaria sordida]